MILNKFKHVILFITTFVFLFEQNVVAQSTNLIYKKSNVACIYSAADFKVPANTSEKEKEKIKKYLELKEKVKAEDLILSQTNLKSGLLRIKIEKYFNDEIVDFLLDTHIEGLKDCGTYITAHPKCKSSAILEKSKIDQDFCKDLISVPDLLINKWNTKDSTGKGVYCVGSDKVNSGSVSSSICSDEKLRPMHTKIKIYNTQHCGLLLEEFRSTKIKAAMADARVEVIEHQMDTVKAELILAKAEREKNDKRVATETECIECGIGGHFPDAKIDQFMADVLPLTCF